MPTVLATYIAPRAGRWAAHDASGNAIASFDGPRAAHAWATSAVNHGAAPRVLCALCTGDILDDGDIDLGLCRDCCRGFASCGLDPAEGWRRVLAIREERNVHPGSRGGVRTPDILSAERRPCTLCGRVVPHGDTHRPIPHDCRRACPRCGEAMALEHVARVRQVVHELYACSACGERARHERDYRGREPLAVPDLTAAADEEIEMARTKSPAPTVAANGAVVSVWTEDLARKIAAWIKEHPDDTWRACADALGFNLRRFHPTLSLGRKQLVQGKDTATSRFAAIIDAALYERHDGNERGGPEAAAEVDDDGAEVVADDTDADPADPALVEPGVLTPRCRYCGCTEYGPCDESCDWVLLDTKSGEGVCSTCDTRDAVPGLAPRRGLATSEVNRLVCGAELAARIRVGLSALATFAPDAHLSPSMVLAWIDDLAAQEAAR